MVRMSVATHRHALMYQEATKDSISLAMRTACGAVNGGHIWIDQQHADFVENPLAKTDEVYRAIVLNSAVLKDATCLAAVVGAAQQVAYPVSIVFSSGGSLAAHFHFYAKNK